MIFNVVTNHFSEKYWGKKENMNLQRTEQSGWFQEIPVQMKAER